MKSLITLGFLFVAMNFCGLSDKLGSLKGGEIQARTRRATQRPRPHPRRSKSRNYAGTAIDRKQCNGSMGDQGLTWKLPPVGRSRM